MASSPRRDRYGRPLARANAESTARLERPPGVGGSYEEACRRAIELFDAKRFFEAHEFFEYVWKSAEVGDGDRPFWKAVTQVAVGCCHAQRGNERGALAVLARAVGQLRSCPSPHAGIHTARLIALARDVAEQVQRRGASDALDFGPFPADRQGD